MFKAVMTIQGIKPPIIMQAEDGIMNEKTVFSHGATLNGDLDYVTCYGKTPDIARREAVKWRE